ncbi:AaceriADR324Wp [[Ashbya] aceris (nom. inval.)]|nr:AaceriADR324Wp [[Ashbya] aceris (nom. inval.)]
MGSKRLISARNHTGAWVTSILVVITFVVFHLMFPALDLDQGDPATQGLSVVDRWIKEQESQALRVNRFYNGDASLMAPFLDKINKYWHVSGTAQIKNWEHIELSLRGQKDRWGVLLSNGIGDNTIDDFETIVDFSIDTQAYNAAVGDGMAIVITSQQDYMREDLHSSYARKQYMLNNALELDNHDLMGFPRNLPGLAIVLDTYKNDPETKLIPPFISMYLNQNPSKEYYDAASDGRRSTSLQLMQLPAHISNGRSKIRIIYLESVGFLKVDIDYSGKGQWIQLFKQATGVQLPKNPATGERYIGIGSRTGTYSQTVILHNVETYEYHWASSTSAEGAEGEDTFDYVQEITKFLKWQLGESIKMEEDEYLKWSLLRTQMFDGDLKKLRDAPPKKRWSPMGFLKRTCIWFAITACVYLVSVYIRVILRRKGILRSRFHKRNFPVGILG